MNLFWKKLFGGITSTEKFEQQQLAFQQSIKHYFEFEKSPELEEFKKLEKTVKSKEFQDQKLLLMKKKYKDSEPYKVLSKFDKLHKNKSIRLYFNTLTSKELKEYLEYKMSPEYFETLNKTKSERQKHFERYENGKEYKNFGRYKDSYVIKEYEELKERISTPEFADLNEFWKNPKRWEKSEEYATEKRYLELVNDPKFATFLKQDPKEMEKYRNWEMTFFDSFNDKGTNNPNWQGGFYFEKPLIGHFSYMNEQQANNEGKNVSFSNGTLKLATRHGKVTTRAWHPTKGFVENQYDYTADVLQTGKSFSQKYGEFQVKLRANGQPHHAFWLGSEKQLPYIQLVQVHGKKIVVGTIDAKGNRNSTTITGLKPSEYFIYTLTWNDKELIWKINNFEVFRTTTNIPANEMYLGVNSYLPEKEKGGEGMIEVDWVKVYNK